MFRRRKSGTRAAQQGLDGSLRELVIEVLPHWDVLDERERDRLEALTTQLVTDLRWEAAAGIELVAEIRVVIAAHVALMGLALPDDAIFGVRGIVVQPDDILMTGEHEYVDGVVTDEASWVSGLADMGGPIMISWEALAEDIDHLGDGRNVVFHEFAHHFDHLDGVADGTPPIDPSAAPRWIEVCTAAYELAAAGGGGDSLDEYAGVNPTEFFAVASEAYFDAPQVLRDEHPELYAVLGSYYGIDYAARFDALDDALDAPAVDSPS